MKKYTITAFWVGRMVIDMVLAQSIDEAKKLFHKKHNYNMPIVEMLIK